MKTGNSKSAAISNANLRSEAKPWLEAGQARNIMNAAGYKHMDRPYAPACGSCAVFMQSEKFVGIHGGKPDEIGIYGQEHNRIAPPLAIVNLATSGIEADFGTEHADTFRRELHLDLHTDYVLANPPFTDSAWFRKDGDVRRQFGVPAKGNADFPLVQRFIHHIAPQGMTGFVISNSSMSSNQSGEGDISGALIEADLVDCMVALPGQLLCSTQIPVCLWFLAENINADTKRSSSNRLGLENQLALSA